MRRLLEALVAAPFLAGGAAFLAWALIHWTPLALMPGVFGVNKGSVVGFAALAGALVALVGLFGSHERSGNKRSTAAGSSKATKATPPPPTGEGDDGAPLTRRQEQHQWYGDNADLDWRDREQAQAWGMDADTYKSNFLESD